MVHRRNFIKQTGLALVACSIAPGFSFTSKEKESLGIQLYSLRDTISQNPKKILRKLANIGFNEIETYGYNDGKFWGLSVAELKEELTKNNLTSPSGHYDGNSLIKGDFENFKEIISVARELDQKYIIIPSIAENLRKSKSDYLNIAEKFNEAGEICKSAGITLAYHNHAFEFKRMDDSTGYEILINNTDKNMVTFEMDIYWVVRGGHDPISLFQKYPGRFKLWHVKDMHKENPELNTEIGNGNINYKEIFNNAKVSGVEHYILEQENFEMPEFKSLNKSYNHLSNLL
ncbi:Sugar phosphate isomerase/epimerase [Salegentibacter agarivorans]|jgi:sugar phosphate isomerase/epimerase|uniref:Sugar phosphate isomerase/epimerase n=1 Tax=Salegentibacter agarivorans TaxID=345907 RepID=A0A1I2M3Q6_9FLAO|nr:Sugar phosphate isomerase/epimerase [Salegentibacter agarivorans]